jgi:endonuclease/exonuclease/phosphatase family metal-dependent hydrolase
MKLLTWNIQWGRGMDGRVDLERTLHAIRALGDFDVICLQEVAQNFPRLPGNGSEDQMAVLEAGFPGYTAIYGAATDVPNAASGRSGFGNALFTRLPVGQVWRHMLPWLAETTTPSMQRGLIEAVIETEIGLLRVMTTHLEYYSQRQREAQVEAIRGLHVEACAMANRLPTSEAAGGAFDALPRPAQAVLCGDMNFFPGAPEYDHLLASYSGDVPGFRDVWSALHPSEPHPATVGIHPVDFVDRPACFDHVFVTEGLVPHLRAHGVDAVTAASDHQPVWIEFR